MRMPQVKDFLFLQVESGGFHFMHDILERAIRKMSRGMAVILEVRAMDR